MFHCCGLFRTQQNIRFVAFHTSLRKMTAVTPEQPEQGTPAPSLRLSRWTAAFSCFFRNTVRLTVGKIPEQTPTHSDHQDGTRNRKSRRQHRADSGQHIVCGRGHSSGQSAGNSISSHRFGQHNRHSRLLSTSSTPSGRKPV